MIELPEARVLAKQIKEILSGKKVIEVIANHSPHKFAWLSGDSEFYTNILKGRKMTGAKAVAGFVEIDFGGPKLLFSDGTRCRYLEGKDKIPKKHQLLLRFDDDSVLVASVQMYGGMWCYEGKVDNEYYLIAFNKPTPYTREFSYEYFNELISESQLENKSVKEVLATKQRIPGLGNGVLQDILFNAKIHPKRKMVTLSKTEIRKLYHSVVKTLKEMAKKGGRDTEKDLFGNDGGYQTKASRLTLAKPCPDCGSEIKKKSYLGGTVYFCEKCQREK